jgi:hypothetical protein
VARGRPAQTTRNRCGGLSTIYGWISQQDRDGADFGLPGQYFLEGRPQVVLVVVAAEAEQQPHRPWRGGRSRCPLDRACTGAWRDQAVTTVVFPDQAARIQAEPNWPALAVTLAEAAQAGDDPVALLHRAVDNRELATADSLTDVLLWRLRQAANVPAAPTHLPPRRRPTPTRRPAPPTPLPPAQASNRRK